MTDDSRKTSGEYFLFYVDDLVDVSEVDKGMGEKEKESEVTQESDEEEDEVVIVAEVQNVPGGPLLQEEMEDDDMEEDNTVPPPPAGDDSVVITDEEPSFVFNDSLEIFFAKPVNESQIVTIESSEDSVTMNGSWGSMMDASTSEDPSTADTQEDKFYDEEGTKGN